MTTAKIGVIGGSGLYQMAALKNVQALALDTPFGAPSDAVMVGELAGVPVAFLARHGRKHHLLPSEIPFRANIHALKQLGVEYLISVAAVGSLQAEVKPLDLVLPDQFIDRTRQRVSTFFGEGIVAHIAFGNPICPQLSAYLATAIANLDLEGVTLHRQGTYVCMEGPAFSTLAESNLYRSWGGTVIGMTNVQEAKLAREAEIAYATLAMVTDYDCWHPDHDHVTVDLIIDNLHKNAANAQRIVAEAVQAIHRRPFRSIAHNALQFAVLTPRENFPPDTYNKLALLLDKYFA